MRHLILNLESPLMAFGGETVDNLDSLVKSLCRPN